MEVLAKRLKWLREKERYSQKEIAEKIGMSAAGYQKIEYGDRDPKLDVLVKFCEVYNISSDFLLGINDSLFELSVVKNDIHDIMGKLETIKYHKNRVEERLLELQPELLSIAQEYGFDSEEFKNEKSELDGLIKMKDKYDYEIRVLNGYYKEKLTEYLYLIYTIPGSKLKKDRIIELHSPISLEVNYDGNEIYDLLIVSGKIQGYVGVLTTCNSAEEAEEVIKDFNDKLVDFGG